MKVHIILLILFFGSLHCEEIHDSNNASADTADLSTIKLSVYKSWRQTNARVFLNADEQIFRQAIFLENLDKINEFNQDSQNTFKMSLNQFSDMTDEEFAAKVLMPDAKISQEEEEADVRKLSAEVDEPENDINIIFRFKSVDWRSKGAVTSVKNQGQCGSCWAFSAAGLMESFFFIKNNSVRDFSEQQLVDCVIPANGAYTSNGCKGGWPQDALKYTSGMGILQESQYPYVAAQGKCRVTTATSGFYPHTYKKLVQTVTDLKKALDFSPVSVLVDATKWKYYSSGIFNQCSSTAKLNHAALLVGYDIFGNWIIKNQWGTGWGESGYMRLRSGNSCGITQSNYQITA